jgi:nucleotide-binding universal stress UspA family protein
MGNKSIQKGEIKTILVPTDFSDPARNALEYAAAIAGKSGAKIIILHIYQIPIATSRGVPFALGHEKVKENIKSAEEQFAKLEIIVSALKNVVYETKLVSGYWTMEFPEIINAQQADLTIMGTKGASGLKEIILGSNTARVIKDSLHPVLAIPWQARYKEIKHIGFAYDGESVDYTVVQPLISLTKLLHTDIKIFHVKTNGNKKRGQSDPEALLNQFFETVNYVYTDFYENDIEEGIGKYILEQDIDILAMIPRKHSLFYRLFNSSITRKMAFHTYVPLLAIPE